MSVSANEVDPNKKWKKKPYFCVHELEVASIRYAVTMQTYTSNSQKISICLEKSGMTLKLSNAPLAKIGISVLRIW